MPAFDLNAMAKLVGIKVTKAKNWTVGRPFTIPASAYQASGRGSINLYSIDDVYLMAVANEFSKAGFAAKAIGKLVAERAKDKGIKAVVFDRGGYHYHGRVKALAEAAREAGLEF